MNPSAIASRETANEGKQSSTRLSVVQGTTPERLLDTAAALFHEKGYAATTTREIAAAVGIQQASLYYHAKSKEELLFKVFVSALDYFLAEVGAAIAEEPDPLRKVHVFIRTHLNVLLKYQQRNVTMLTELRALSGQYRTQVIARRGEYARLVRAVLEQAQAAGVIRTDVPAKYLYLALLNLLNRSTLWFKHSGPLTPDGLADFFIELFLSGAASPATRGPLRLGAPWTPAEANPETAAAMRTEEKTAGKLLSAAALLFGEKGYHMTSMREIANAVGIQKASMYYHFKTKEDLLFAICESSLQRMISALQSALATVEDPLERTKRFIAAHICCALQDEEAHGEALAEMRALSEDRLAKVFALRDTYAAILRSVLNEAQASGVIRQDMDVKFLALGLLGMMNRVEVWFRPGGELSPQQVGDLMAAVFLTGAGSL